ncbi:hypothetical protein LFM09_01145 [Lentzea alba]|uniref:hypothetical protein n=1 Tax=Lentzea alba TaxID=2714351 RepID=UPI0039BF19D4
MRRLGALLGSALVAIATLTATAQAAPVGALAVTTVKVDGKESALDSTAVKDSVANCPAGMVALGGGFTTAVGSGQNGSVVIDEMIIRDHFVLVTAREDANGTSGPWSVKAFAVCSNPLPGYEIKLGRSANIGSEFEKPAVATCSPGKVVVGGGFGVTGAQGEVLVDELLPGTNQVFTKAFEGKAGTSKNWFLDAYAVCAFQPVGWEIVNKPGPIHSLSKSTSRTCPAGKKLLGPMFDLTDSLGQAHMMAMLPNSSQEVSLFAIEDDDGTSNSWGLNNWQVCAS